MPYTRITAGKSAYAAIRYCRGPDNNKGHNNSLKRNLVVTSIGLLPDEVVPYDKQIEALCFKGKHVKKNQVQRIILSFSEKEFDPNSKEDLIKAEELTVGFTKKTYPDHPAVIFLQADGVGGKLHAHIILSNVNKDGKALDHTRRFADLKKAFNDYCLKDASHLITLDFGNKHKVKEKESSGERGLRIRKEKEGRTSPVLLHREVMKPLIEEEMPLSQSRYDFRQRMKSRGIDVKYKTSSKYGEYILYTLEDRSLIPKNTKVKNLSAKSYKMGEKYDIQELDRQVLENYNKATASMLNNHENKVSEYETIDQEDDDFLMEEEYEIIGLDDVPSTWEEELMQSFERKQNHCVEKPEEEQQQSVQMISERINDLKEETVYPRTRDLRRLIMKEDNKNNIDENNKGGVEK